MLEDGILFLWPYSKSNVELESNLSEILPTNCKFICVLPQLILKKIKLEYLEFGFECKKKKNINTDENSFASIELDFFRVQLKFAFEYGR